MGHLGPKEAYLRLADKINTMPCRAPRNETLYKILKELYSPEEADVVARMPYGLSDLERVAKITEHEPERLKKLLDGLCNKGLVMDIFVNDRYQYTPSPMVIGIFEFTMMRTRGQLDYKKWARLFHEYLSDPFYAANYRDGQVISLLRSIPHEEAIEESEFMEVLDYEKATSIVKAADTFAIGICSCRHEKTHAGKRECDTPLYTCSTFGLAADYWIRNGLAKKASRSEMMDNIARSKDLGLAFCGDNVKKNITFICHCCKCCCNALAGISKYGYANAVVTSNYIARVRDETCIGCGKCAKACPIEAIEMRPTQSPHSKRRMTPAVDESFCIGCGVCAGACAKASMRLTHREQRVLHPDTVFERVILGSLERGTLEYQIFDNPENITQKFLRGFVGGFFRLPPVKKALMSERYRSRFLDVMKKGVRAQGKDWILDM